LASLATRQGKGKASIRPKTDPRFLPPHTRSE